MAGSFCTICRRRIPRGSRCSRHRTISPSSRAWHEPGAPKVRKQLLSSPGAGCAVCGATADLEVHHVTPAADGGATTPGNLVVLCRRHHLEAEAEKRAGYSGSLSSLNKIPLSIAGVAANRAKVSGGKPRGSIFS
jgi:5-methylcytosine-specific restriction endonuclease McrA